MLKTVPEVYAAAGSRVEEEANRILAWWEADITPGSGKPGAEVHRSPQELLRGGFQAGFCRAIGWLADQGLLMTAENPETAEFKLAAVKASRSVLAEHVRRAVDEYNSRDQKKGFPWPFHVKVLMQALKDMQAFDAAVDENADPDQVYAVGAGA